MYRSDMKAQKKVKNKKKSKTYKNSKCGRRFLDEVIDKIPLELHLPKYQYCGPGTKLAERLARGDPGINKLDSLCKDHDIAYENHKDSSQCCKAE